MQKTTNYKLALGILVAILILAPWSLDLGFIPLTLQTLIIFIGASLLPWRTAILVVGAYLALGALGLPVFGHHTSGFAKLYGATAGFLWGFVACAGYVAYASARQEFHFFRAILIFLRAHLLLLIPGFAVLYYYMPGADLWNTLIHLIPGLIIKSLVGGIIAAQLRAKLVPVSDQIASLEEQNESD